MGGKCGGTAGSREQSMHAQEPHQVKNLTFLVQKSTECVFRLLAGDHDADILSKYGRKKTPGQTSLFAGHTGILS